MLDWCEFELFALPPCIARVPGGRGSVVVACEHLLGLGLGVQGAAGSAVAGLRLALLQLWQLVGPGVWRGAGSRQGFGLAHLG